MHPRHKVGLRTNVKTTGKDHMQELAEQTATNDGWPRLEPKFGAGPGSRASIGLLALATDRVGAADTEQFLSAEGVTVFSTRVPMSPVATPETLRSMGEHLEQAARLLVPGSRLDVIGFSWHLRHHRHRRK